MAGGKTTSVTPVTPAAIHNTGKVFFNFIALRALVEKSHFYSFLRDQKTRSKPKSNFSKNI